MSKPVETNPFVKQRPELDDVAKVIDFSLLLLNTCQLFRSALPEESFKQNPDVSSAGGMVLLCSGAFSIVLHSISMVNILKFPNLYKTCCSTVVADSILRP